MKKLNLDQKGFGLIEGLLVLILLTLVGFTGYYVWHTQKQTDKTYNTSSKTDTSAKAKATKVVPVYDQSGVTLYDLSDIAQGNDQKQIIAAIQSKCQKDSPPTDGSQLIVVGAKDIFSDSSIFGMSGGFARISTGCRTKPVQPEDGGAQYVLQKISGKWTVLWAGQMEANCSDVDGKQIPATVVASCYDETTSQDRAPK